MSSNAKVCSTKGFLSFQLCLQDNVQLVECLKRKSVDELQSVNVASFRFLSAFGPIVDGIVVPYEPRLIMESLAYGANAPSSSSTSGKSNPTGHVFSGDILFGVTRLQSPLGLFSAYDERYGIDVERRNQVLRTLVRNMFDFHQQVNIFFVLQSHFYIFYKKYLLRYFGFFNLAHFITMNLNKF